MTICILTDIPMSLRRFGVAKSLERKQHPFWDALFVWWMREIRRTDAVTEVRASNDNDDMYSYRYSYVVATLWRSQIPRAQTASLLGCLFFIWWTRDINQLNIFKYAKKIRHITMVLPKMMCPFYYAIVFIT